MEAAKIIHPLQPDALPLSYSGKILLSKEWVSYQTLRESVNMRENLNMPKLLLLQVFKEESGHAVAVFLLGETGASGVARAFDKP